MVLTVKAKSGWWEKEQDAQEGEAGAAFSANGPPPVAVMWHVQVPHISGFQLPSDFTSLPFVAIAQLLSQGPEKKVFNPHSRICLHNDIRERGREGERHQSVASRPCTDQGSNPKPEYVPSPGTEPVTL